MSDNRITIEFPYDHPDRGSVNVEASFTIQPKDIHGESDWDYNGFQDLDYLAVFQKGQQIFVDIPDDVLYHHLRDKLRDLEISGCYSKENGEI